MRKRNLLRLLTAILFFAVITPGVFANGQKEKTSDSEKITESKAISNKPIEFTMLYSDNASYGYKKDWITLQKMTEFRITSYNVCYTKLLRPGELCLRLGTRFCADDRRNR